jgi:hypothetical protein
VPPSVPPEPPVPANVLSALLHEANTSDVALNAIAVIRARRPHMFAEA